MPVHGNKKQSVISNQKNGVERHSTRFFCCRGLYVAIRTLLKKMNIHVVEPDQTGTKAVCCGDSLHREADNEQVYAFMKKRGDAMPREDVVVYCTSCIKALANGGKTPRYLVDLLLGLGTEPGNTDVDVWHKALDNYIAEH